MQRVDVTESCGLQARGAEGLLGSGKRYSVEFDARGMRFVPALGSAASELQHLSLRPVSVRRGNTEVISGPLAAQPERVDLRARFEHARGVVERYDVAVDGVELSWQFDERPAGSGDLVVRYALDTSLPTASPARHGGLAFLLPEIGGVTIGAVTGIDANGTRVAGSLRHVDGVLEMSLPESFVDAATYPIVLDPLVGTNIDITMNIWNNGDPDVAYDSSTGTWLVVFTRKFSAVNAWPYAQRVDSAGSLVGGLISVNPSAVCEHVRTAGLGTHGRFGVVFEETVGIANGIQFRAIDATTGAITHAAVLASSTGVNLFSDPDIGADSQAFVGATRGFVAVYRDEVQNAIRARKIYFDGSDSLVSPSPVNVMADGGVLGPVFTQPEISRGCGLRQMVVARRFSGIGPFVSVQAVVLNSESLAVEAATSFGGSSTDAIERPDVDGCEDQWVVAWQRTPSVSGLPSIRRCTLDYAPGSGLSVGTIEALGGSLGNQASEPTVGYSPGRTWLGYRRFSTFGGTYSLRSDSIDAASSTWCENNLNESVTLTDVRMVVATATSGGVNGGETAMACWEVGGDIWAQRLLNYGTSGSYSNLGGGCGQGGNPYFSHEPGIGSSAILCGITNLPPTAIATVFNFAVPTGSLPCGPCVWTPFEFTLIPPITVSQSSVSFPLPCLPGLVGAQFEIQWTTLDVTQAPCPVFSDLVLSDRMQMTIGN